MTRVRRSLIGRNRVLCLLALAILLVAPGVRAAVDTVRTDNVTARLVASLEQVKPGDTVSVMLHQDIREGWHTYWKNPGDSGQETAIEWSLPEGASAAPIQWAAPDRIEFAGLVNHGYSNRVGLISDITVPADWPEGTAFPVKAEATWLVCEKVCIPESAAFDITVPTGGATVANGADAALFAAVRGTIPVSSPWPVSATVRGDRISLAFNAPGLALERLSEPHFFANAWGVVAHAAEQRLSYADGTLQVTLKRGEIPAPEMLSGVFTLREDTGGQSARLAFAVDGVVLAAAAPVSDPMPVAGADGMTLPVILIFAFLGGMLLNLMPCVFPVLAIKALGLVSHAGNSRAGRLRGGLAYMAGVLLAFPLFASAAWLVWVLAQQADPDAVLAVLLGMTALGFALWLFGQGGGAVRRGIALLSVCGALWLAAVIQPSDAGVAMARAEGSEPFSQARFEALRAEGRPVLVNMTAAWCITCKVNERVALSSDAFHAALAASGTAYLVGDWTREDPEITALLRRYDRAGVPL